MVNFNTDNNSNKAFICVFNNLLNKKAQNKLLNN